LELGIGRRLWVLTDATKYYLIKSDEIKKTVKALFVGDNKA
jgi:hypothetical protein